MPPMSHDLAHYLSSDDPAAAMEALFLERNQARDAVDQWAADALRIVAERDRLRAVVAEYQRAYHALDHALDDDQVEAVEPQMREWQAAQLALLETPAGPAREGT